MHSRGNIVWELTVLLGVALGSVGHEHHAVSHQSVVMYHGHHGELSHIGSHTPEHHAEYAWSYPSYEFSYNVDDPHTHDYKGQHEVRDGDNVKGMYWLIQPDGRKRTVTYYVDKDSGFNAHVEYSDPYHNEKIHEENHPPMSEIYHVINHFPYKYQQHDIKNNHYDVLYGEH